MVSLELNGVCERWTPVLHTQHHYLRHYPTVTWGWRRVLPTVFCSLSWATLGSHMNSEMINMS